MPPPWSAAAKPTSSSSSTQYVHSQVPEVIKTIGERCPSVTVTMNKERAYFLLSIEHESALKGPVRRRNHVTVVNRDGDVVFSKNDRELGNAIKDACPSMRLTPQQIWLTMRRLRGRKWRRQKPHERKRKGNRLQRKQPS